MLDDFRIFEAQLLGENNDEGEAGVVLDIIGIDNDTGDQHLKRLIMDRDFAKDLHEKLATIFAA